MLNLFERDISIYLTGNVEDAKGVMVGKYGPYAFLTTTETFSACLACVWYLKIIF